MLEQYDTELMPEEAAEILRIGMNFTGRFLFPFIVPVKEYKASEIQDIRKRTGISQQIFASYIGVSTKTVEAWEVGMNHPSGAASRILSMMEMDVELTKKFPFVQS